MKRCSYHLARWLLAPCVLTQVAAKADLIGHWAFDETAGDVAVDSVHGNNGFFQSATLENLQWVEGRIGGAANLSDLGSDDFFRVEYIEQMAGALALTISVWIDPDPNSNSTYNGIFMTRTVNGGENWGVALENSAQPYHIDGRTPGSPNQLDSANVIRDDAGWYHVVFVWDGLDGSRKTYINGKLEGSNTGGPLQEILDSGTWFIGYDDCCGGTREFDGLIDDLGVWNQALTASEVAILASGVSASKLDTGDSDGDGMPNAFEGQYTFLNPADAADAVLDEDGDGLDNLTEYKRNTDPGKADTDGDGLKDGEEIEIHMSDPRLADTDGDGIPDGEEVVKGNDTYVTNVLVADTDGDGLLDGAEVAGKTDPTDPLSPLPPEPVPPGLIGYWTFDEGAGGRVIDHVHGNDGVWRNGVDTNLAWVPGLIGGAADLSDAGGDSYFEIASINQLLRAGAITMTAWIDPDPQTGYNGIFMTRTFNGRTDNSWGMAYEGNAGAEHLDSRVDGPGIDSFEGSLPPDAGWMHIALVWDGAAQTHTQYVNGEESNSTGVAFDVIEGLVSGPWYLGYDNCCGGGRDFDGLLDDVSLWTEALDADAIRAIYEKGLTGVGAGTKREPRPPSIVKVSRRPGLGLSLTWTSEPNRVYSVLFSRNPSGPVSGWSTLQADIPSQGAETTVDVTFQAGDESGFYVVARND